MAAGGEQEDNRQAATFAQGIALIALRDTARELFVQLTVLQTRELPKIVVGMEPDDAAVMIAHVLAAQLAAKAFLDLVG